ncbi:MAG: glycoside hydrolase family 13 protein [Bowdeniella nasicola]|nr:glycoside hydrolase family 13 protein [Bowdeniella nasicola]
MTKPDTSNRSSAAQPSPTPPLPWWHSAVIYQIYPRSFASSGGGLGTLTGITDRLDYLRDLGVDALWLSPFYPSPQHDAGYDVASYTDVDPRFGTLEDADRLIAGAHERGLRIIIDLVPNHTSDEHPWFRAALEAGPGSRERERYWFRESDERPNDWRSVFGGPAWTRVCDRPDAPSSPWEDDRHYYLHLFDSTQPDLNWENPDVLSSFEQILRFWLDRGVDGFRIDVAHGLVKDPSLPAWSGDMSMVQGAEGARPPMFDQEGVHDIYRRFNEVLAEYDGDRMLVAEAWVNPPERLARYVRPGELHQAFNFDFLCTPWRATDLAEIIRTTRDTFAAVGAPPTWVLSNHDVVRHASRLGLSVTGKGPNGIGAHDEQPDAALGLRRARAATALMLALPGSAYLYQGEERGLPEHTRLPDQLREDPTFARTQGAELGRDGCRIPLPWRSDAPAFGFSPDGETWLPQPEGWEAFCVDRQEADPDSTLNLYRRLLELRRTLGLGEAEAEIEAVGEEELRVRLHTESDEIQVFTTFDAECSLAEDLEVLVSSAPLTDEGKIPADTTVWARRR